MGLNVSGISLNDFFESLPLFSNFLVVRKLAFMILGDKLVENVN